MTVLIIGGSREAEKLHAQVPDAALLDGEDLPDTLTANAVIDASHPCERDTPARIADRIGSVPLLRLRRTAWEATAQDTWTDVADADTAHRALRPEWRRVFLCLGEADRAPFAGEASRWYLVRTRALGAIHPPHSEVTDKAGPFTTEDEAALMVAHGIDVLVTRNAGGQGAIPKVLAARKLGLPVVMLARPPALAPEVATIEEALTWLHACAGR